MDKSTNKLTYGNQLEFKKWVRKELKIGDVFYFDYITGVWAESAEDIPGLVADGNDTWGEAKEILANFIASRNA